MENPNMMTLFAGFVTLVLAFATVGAGVVFAHCDTMDGPIIKSDAAGVKPPRRTRPREAAAPNNCQAGEAL